MKKTLLLLAGCPGTGKSYLDNWIRKEIPGFYETSIDVFKEQLYDQYGFDNLEERSKLDDKAYDMFYKSVENLMQEGKSIISDYPFSYRQHDILQKIANDYDYQIITITLTADLDVLYGRQQKRDLDQDRHLGHLMTHYHKGDVLLDRSKIEIKKTKAEYKAFNEKRKYADFSLGKTLFLDVTDFSKADYSGTINQIKEWVE